MYELCVDLNPIGAGVSNLPEFNDFTCKQQRIYKMCLIKYSNSTVVQIESEKKVLLLVFSCVQLNHIHDCSISAEDYVELLDRAGRKICEDNRGAISVSESTILYRLNIYHQFAVSTCGNYVRIYNFIKAAIC